MQLRNAQYLWVLNRVAFLPEGACTSSVYSLLKCQPLFWLYTIFLDIRNMHWGESKINVAMLLSKAG